MNARTVIIAAFLCFVAKTGITQPFIDIINYNFQTYSGKYKSHPQIKNRTDNHVLNFFVPIKLNEQNILLFRLNNEGIGSTIFTIPDSTRWLYSTTFAIGFQKELKNKKWKSTLMIMPKLASEFSEPLGNRDFQIGGFVLFNYLKKENVKWKFGLFYNREAFGNFIIPLIGLDWKVNKKLYLYGTLPSMYKVEYSIAPGKLYTGFGFKSFTRSFRLSQKDNYDFVRYDEMQLKLFLDYYIFKKLVCFAEAGYSIGKNPIQYKFGSRKDKVQYNQIYTRIEPFAIFNFGIAYRVRQDLDKKE